MKKLWPLAAIAGVIGLAALGVQAQNAPAQGQPAAQGQGGQGRGRGQGRGDAAGQTTTTPPGQQPKADPYANNAAPGTTTFPLAAKAGVDSNARNVAPEGAVNQGPFSPNAWKYGTAFNPPAGAKIWNPVKLKMLQGG